MVGGPLYKVQCMDRSLTLKSQLICWLIFTFEKQTVQKRPRE